MTKNLAQLGLQLLEIWKQLGLNQRVSIVFTALVVLGGLLSLVFWSNRADYTLLYGRLDDTEAAKVIAALEEAKVPYKTGQGKGTIHVPADKVYSMRMQLASRGLPRNDGAGYELFEKQPFGLSDFMQRVNYLRAVQGELSRTIGQLDEVDGARVMIVMPENRLLTDNQKRSTASVFVRVKGQTTLAPQAINSIRFLVANAVEGLQPNHVTVVDNRGNVLSENTEADSLIGLTSGQLAIRRAVEQDLARKAEDMLHKVLGPGQAVVRVSADINFDSINRTEEKIDPDSIVARSTTTTDETTDSNTAAGAGVAGLTSNISTDTNNAATPLNMSRIKKKVTNNQNDFSKTTSTVLQAPGGIKRLSAAVVVAAKMEGTGAERKVVPRTEDELKRLRALVQSALGVQMATDGGRLDELTLEEMPFNDQGSLELSLQLDQQQRHEFWWNLVRTLAYPMLALTVLGIFMRAFKRTSAETIPIGIPLSQFSGNGGGNGSRTGNGHGTSEWGKTPEPGVVTVEVLNRLVRENPSNMNQAIRSWLTNGKSNAK
jgi:flagellar M-ring protein FliF